MKNLKLATFLAGKDMLNNLSSLLFISAALSFLFANLLFVRFIMYGFETSIGSLISKVSGHAYVRPLRGESYIYNTEEALKEIINEDSIKNINPILEMPCALEYKGSRITTTIWGVEFNEEVMELKNHITKGRYFSNPEAKEIILGKLLKRRFEQKIRGAEEIHSEDTLKAFFIKEHNIGKFNRDVYRNEYCKVIGTVDLRDYVANNFIFMPIKALRDIVTLNDRASFLFIRLKDDVAINGFNLEKLKSLDTQGEVKHWKDRDDSGTDDIVHGFNVIGVITFIVSIICTAILVAFVIYFNTQKKRREIGILRAIGIKDNIFLIFFILEGLFFAIIGVVFGTAIYYALELYLRTNPIVMPFGDLYPIFEVKSYIFATLLFLVVSFAASVYYAVKSSRENIIKIVRGD